MLSSASSSRYEEQRSPPPSSPPPEDLEVEGEGPGGEATDGGDDLDDIFDLATNMNSDRIEGQRSAGPSPIKQSSTSTNSTPENRKGRERWQSISYLLVRHLHREKIVPARTARYLVLVQLISPCQI